MKVSALFPYKADDGFRDLLWSYVQKRYEKLMPDVEICVGVDCHEPFCRSRAVNDAARKATGDLFMIVDTDVIYNPCLINGITSLIPCHPWVIPYTNGYKLSRKATGDILEKGLAGFLPVKKEDIEINITLAGSFINAMTRKAFEAVNGFDERFQGWGGEDNAFVMSLDTICGQHYRMNEDIYHLWHPPAKVDAENYRNNLLLCQRYQAAYENKDVMKSLISEHDFNFQPPNSGFYCLG
jgi:hypothetical protein